MVLNRNTYKAAIKLTKMVDLNYTAQGQRKFIAHEIVTLWAAPFQSGRTFVIRVGFIVGF